jgi:putative membrane protein
MQTFFTHWHIDFWIFLFLIFISWGYLQLTRFRLSGISRYFFAGLALIILSVASPLRFLGENYQMSAHMMSHVILLLIASPLLVMGIPEDFQNKSANAFFRRISKYPVLCWATGVCIMWFWHIPAIFNHLYDPSAYQEYEKGFFHVGGIVQNIQMISLISAGIVFSWPILGPVRSQRIPPLNAVLYLSGACVFCSILGLLITFAPQGVYAHFEQPFDRIGFLNMIRNQNGISAVVDQQIAGLIMWVPGCLIYLSASMFLLMNWFKAKKQQHSFHNHNIVS